MGRKCTLLQCGAFGSCGQGMQPCARLPLGAPELTAAGLQVMCEAMADPAAATGDELRKPYHKLLTSFEARAAAFSMQQQQHLACWKLWVLLRLQLFTDDSFIFNKVSRNVQELLQQLPDVEGSEEDEACARIQVRVWWTSTAASVGACHASHE
jgi:hypothetical protein